MKCPYRMNLYSFYLSAALAIIGAGCNGASGENEQSTDDSSSVVGDKGTQRDSDHTADSGLLAFRDCEDGSRQCNGDMLEMCTDGKWRDFDDCEIQSEVCTVLMGVYQCVSRGDTDYHTDSRSDTDTDSGIYTDTRTDIATDTDTHTNTGSDTVADTATFLDTDSETMTTEDCVDNDRRCVVDILQICMNSRWRSWDDCALQSMVCTSVANEYKCADIDDVDKDTENDTTSASDTDTVTDTPTDADTIADTTQDSPCPATCLAQGECRTLNGNILSGYFCPTDTPICCTADSTDTDTDTETAEDTGTETDTDTGTDTPSGCPGICLEQGVCRELNGTYLPDYTCPTETPFCCDAGI
ncbi:MAG: hypothetical protein JXX14_10640 [Deltaproteobacteria bacterium]|nr:hypothetical protein [Deltaproteobacteria bacterium]